MTQPGYVAPASPGWWVRTNRVGIAASSYHLVTTAFSSDIPTGGSTGTYGWSGVGSGASAQIAIAGVNSSTANTVTIPTHAIGQIILLWVYRSNSNTTATKPSASGTVPAWVDVVNNTGTNTNSARIAYFVATATNHTSGSWTNATGMIAVVMDHQNVSPIGGSAEAGGSNTTQSVAPSITLSVSNGSSLILHFFGSRNATVDWLAAPTGYTHVVNSGPLCMNVKNVSTTDGSCTQTHQSSGIAGYSGATVEVLD